jgi:heme-degrading monooxygenase HmoA
LPGGCARGDRGARIVIGAVRKGSPMYARVNFIFGTPEAVDAGIAHLEDVDRGVVEVASGNRGLTTLVNRQHGVIVAISYWDDPLRSSDPVLTRARERAAATAGGEVVVERYEVMIDERLSTPMSGAVARMTRLQIEPARFADGIAFFRTEVMPSLRNVPGLCCAELLIDPDSRRGVFMTLWRDEEGAARMESLLDNLHDEALERSVAEFPRTEAYTVVRAAVEPGRPGY